MQTKKTTVERARRVKQKTRTDPEWFAKHVLGLDYWQKQKEIVRAVAKYDLISVRSANGVGKSFTAASLVPWFLAGHRPGYAVTTSSSWTSVQRTLWPEIHRIKSNAPNIDGGITNQGDILNLEWKWGPQWGAFAVSTKTPENFSGFRTPHGVFVIVDEASALEEDIFDAIMGLCSTEGSKVLLVGNPLRPAGPFHATFGDPDWKNIHISAMESPNVITGKNVVPGLATRTWVERMTRKWGKGSHQHIARVLGEFPDSEEDTVIPKTWLEDAIVEAVGRIIPPLYLGVDVARYGSDRTVLLIRDARAVRHTIVTSKKSTMETAGLTKKTMEEWGIAPDKTYIDDTGLGGAVTDRLHEQMLMVRPVIGGAGATDPDFLNCRAQCYWGARLAFDPDGECLLIPREYADLAAECAVPRYKITSNGKLKIEEKDEIKKRLGRSPDLADALALTFADVDTGRITVDTLW